jgi:hypothetical protein
VRPRVQQRAVQLGQLCLLNESAHAAHSSSDIAGTFAVAHNIQTHSKPHNHAADQVPNDRKADQDSFFFSHNFKAVIHPNEVTHEQPHHLGTHLLPFTKPHSVTNDVSADRDALPQTHAVAGHHRALHEPLSCTNSPTLVGSQ